MKIVSGVLKFAQDFQYNTVKPEKPRVLNPEVSVYFHNLLHHMFVNNEQTCSFLIRLAGSRARDHRITLFSVIQVGT